MRTVPRSAFVAHSLPFYGNIMKGMRLPQIITKAVGKCGNRADVDAGTMVAAMILDMLSENRIHLVGLESFYEDKPMSLLFPWRPGLRPGDLDQYRAGDVLDQLYEAGPQKVFSELTRSVVAQYGVPTDRVHFDTSTKSFQGAFEGRDDLAVRIAHGKSKDNRPDLKQIVFGVGVSSDGVPLAGEILSGNASDKTINGGWIANIRSWLGKEDYDFLLYVADCAVVTPKNLGLFARHRIDFVTRFPHTYNLADDLVDWALARPEGEWTRIGATSEEKGAAEYRCVGFRETLEGREYMFYVYHSSSKDERKKKTLKKEVKRERADLRKRIDKFTGQEFSCEDDARKAALWFAKSCGARLHTVSWTVEARTVVEKWGKRGRPPKDFAPRSEKRFVVRMEPVLDKEAYGREELKCGMFVLFTTLDGATHDGAAVLRIYKEQDGVERLFRLLKSPELVGSYCLEKPERIVAFGFVVLMAVLVFTLSERLVRKSLERKGEGPIEGLHGRETKKPTANAIRHVLTPIIVVARTDGGAARLEPDIPLTDNQRRVLRLAGFDEGIYTAVL